MPDRRGARPSQVRPRPPSTGRPAPAKVQPRAPVPGRAVPHRRVERSRGIPLATRLLIVVVLVGVAAAAVFTATGGLARAARGVSATVDGMLAELNATPSPRATIPVIADAPLIEAPAEPYTNQPTVDLVVALPRAVVGDPASRVKLFLTRPEERRRLHSEVPVGTSPSVVVPDVELAAGRNDFSATIEGPAGESEPSSVVTFVFDDLVPKIGISAPRNGDVVNGKTVRIVGKSQGRSAVFARNAANNASVTATAASDGTFELVMPLASGRSTNAITIAATDPAGNTGELILTVERGPGKLTAALRANPGSLDLTELPSALELRVVVEDPDDNPVEGAQVTFTLEVPGIPVVTADGTTDERGRAEFQTTIPTGARLGEGLATVLVRTKDFGDTTDRAPVNVVEP